MTYTIPMKNGIITCVETDFICPRCECPHDEDFYSDHLFKSKHGIIKKKCKGCKTWLGITTDIKGDVVVWLKNEETKQP